MPPIRTFFPIRALKAVLWTGIAEMPTRSYFFPKEFSHVENILQDDPSMSEASLRQFRSKGIAPLNSGMDLSIVLGIGPGLIASMLLNQKKYYRTNELRKNDGTFRKLSCPRTYLKVVQWWILDNILNPLEYPSNAFGFIKGKSILDNASHHLGSRHFLNVDIKSFFDSVTEEQVFHAFSGLGYNEKTSKVLARLCSFCGCLPQGAPTSPALGNLIFSPLDTEIERISKERNIKYSRYADDLTFSCRSQIQVSFLDEINKVVGHAGFQLKGEKTRFRGPGGRTEVTGLVVRDFIQPPVNWRKLQRARLHRLSLKSTLDREDMRYLEGIRGYCSQFKDAVQMVRLSEAAENLLKQETRSDHFS